MMPSPGPRRFAFRPPWWGLLLAAAGCAAGIALGNWQMRRADDKRALAASLVPLTLRGTLEPKYTVFLDNKLHQGRPGYQVVQPLRLAGGRWVLVNRGWIAMKGGREASPAVRTPRGEVVLTGIRLPRFARVFQLQGTRPEGTVWQNVSIETFAAWSGLALEPYVLEQHSKLDDGLVRDWPPPDFGIEMHESYALQWYSLAGLALILFVVLNFKRERAAP
jgi:surfeit locus 1 family protein